MNKETVEAIIDYFIKEVGTSHGFLVKQRIKDNPVKLGDVLARMQDDQTWEHSKKVVELWLICGANKSLNSLVEASGYERLECIDENCKCGKFPLRNDNCPCKERLADKPTRELFEFLNQIKNNN